MTLADALASARVFTYVRARRLAKSGDDTSQRLHLLKRAQHK